MLLSLAFFTDKTHQDVCTARTGECSQKHGGPENQPVSVDGVWIGRRDRPPMHRFEPQHANDDHHHTNVAIGSCEASDGNVPRERDLVEANPQQNGRSNQTAQEVPKRTGRRKRERPRRGQQGQQPKRSEDGSETALPAYLGKETDH